VLEGRHHSDRWQLGMVLIPVIPAPRRWGWEDYEFEGQPELPNWNAKIKIEPKQKPWWKLFRINFNYRRRLYIRKTFW
jgi:hypothetical protein